MGGCSSPPTPLSTLSRYGNSSCNYQLTMDHLLHMSPPPPNPALNFANRLHVRSSFSEEAEKDGYCDSFTSVLSNSERTKVKSSWQLMKEIAALELQIVQLERYLLSLYRTAFQYVPASLETPKRSPKDKIRPHAYSIDAQPRCIMDLHMSRCDVGHPHPVLLSTAVAGSDDAPVSRSTPVAGSDGWVESIPKSSSRRGTKQADSSHRSLADHLGAFHMDYILHYPDRLSEEIVRCISSIYCKFSNPALPRKGLSVSSTSSLSSSSTFSPRDISSSWSPQFNEEAKNFSDFEGQKDEICGYAATIEVSDLYLDDGSFKYAATMLQKLSSLVKSLEKVDPRKMKREEKLAFWLNIHNSLMMHAYLAYGTHNFVRSASVLKAAYNVGGYCINAPIIQSSILGIRSHYSAPWLQTLLSPRKRFVTGSAEHPFTMDYPEPLVHFALCSGACHDPMVRVYKAENIFQDLRMARDEFIRANAYIHKEKKICLPKIVSYFARDMSQSMSQILETVCSCFPELQQKAITARMKSRPEKRIFWIPQSSSFRYLIQKEVTQETHF